MPEKRIGKVVHYFKAIQVAALSITDNSIAVGEVVHFKGRTTDFSQPVESLQVEHQAVQQAGVGQDVATKVAEPVRPGDEVYKVIA